VPADRGWRRRHLLRAALAGTAALAVRRAEAAPLSSKTNAHYQTLPKDGFSCAICTQFRPPQSCAAVEGAISPHGWCRFFDMPD